jgi:hypothetical protein
MDSAYSLREYNKKMVNIFFDLEILIKGTVSLDFLLLVFLWISFPPAPEYRVRTISNFFKNARLYSQVKVHQRYQRHRQQILPQFYWYRWQTIGTISGCRYLKVNLKAKIYIYVNSTIQRCPNKIIKIFLIEDFFSFAAGVNDTGGQPWAANISANFRKNSKRP